MNLGGDFTLNFGQIVITLAVLSSPFLLAWQNSRNQRDAEARAAERDKVKQEAAEAVQATAAQVATDAREGIERAAELAATAATTLAKQNEQSMESAAELIRVVRGSDARLDGISLDVRHTKTIINHDREVTLGVLATMARRIAKENPDDIEAQLAWQAADEAVKDARAGNLAANSTPKP